MQIELILIIAFLLAVIFWLYTKQNKEKILLNDLQSQMKKLENELLDTADNIVNQIQEVSIDLEEKLEDAHGTLAVLREEISLAEKKKFALNKIDIDDLVLNFSEARDALEDLKLQISNIEQRKNKLMTEKYLAKQVQQGFNQNIRALPEERIPVEAEVVFDFPTLLGQSETALVDVEDKQFFDDENLSKHERIVALLEQGCLDEDVAKILGIGTNEVFLTKKLNRNR